jgi:KDO2-lipid IV(A) lauroyltransferase
VQHNGSHLQTLRRNLTVLTGSPADDALLRRAIASYLRNFAETLTLQQWSGADIRGRVTTINESVLRTAYAGTGAVVALPHSGNWDLAGAWACLTGMPVTTVAEQLGDDEYADFVAFRERLGMEVLSHRDPNAISELVFAVRRRRLVCLLADRDLEHTGVPVRWASQHITMPAGPAMIARRSGAALIPAVCQFTPAGMQIIFGDPISPEPGRTGLRAMTQQIADFFADTLADQPEDWHMMQPFFADPERA